MTEPLNISVNKSFVPYGGKVFASFENGWGVTVQVYEGETLLTQQEMTYAEYVALQKEALPVPLPDYPDPRLNRTPGGTNANGNTIGRVVGETAPATVLASQANPPIKAETDTEKGWWNSASPWVHGGLDALGFVPGLGAIPDLINAGIYAAEGDVVNASLSAVAAIPFVGDAVKGGVLAGRGVKKTNTLAVKEASTPASKAAHDNFRKHSSVKTSNRDPISKSQAGPKSGKDGGKSKGGPCNHLRKGSGKGAYRGGAHNQTSRPVNDGKDSHHMPADDASPLPKRDGPAIQMHPDDHRLTKSNGSAKGSAKYRQSIEVLLGSGKWRDAMIKEIKDIRRIQNMIGEPGKYNEAMLEMLRYFRCLERNHLLS